MRVMLFNNDKELICKLIKRIGADKEIVEYMTDKSSFYNIWIDPVSLPIANILKQTAISVGADIVTHREVITGKFIRGPVLLMATYNQMIKMKNKLTNQPWKLQQLMEDIIRIVNYKPYKWEIGSRIISFNKPIIMGILNITPDSFYDGGKWEDEKAILERVKEMVEEGVDIIDIGGESSRPFSDPVNEEEEWRRVYPVIKMIKKEFNIPISLDTYKSSIAQKGIEEGVDIINDISGLKFDYKMGEIIANSNVGIVLMHIKGSPKDMQKNPNYDFIFEEIYDYLEEGVKELLSAGIEKERIVIDPGIGFGKTVEDNLLLIKNMNFLRGLEVPILIGLSRKSFMGKILGLENPADRLNATTVMHTIALINGANILRVHDVKEAKEIIELVGAYDKSSDII